MNDEAFTKWIEDVQNFNETLKDHLTDSEFISIISYLVTDAAHRTKNPKTTYIAIMAILQGANESELQQNSTDLQDNKKN